MIKLVNHIKSKYSPDITMEQLLSEFNFELYTLNKDDVGGLYLYNNNAIGISEVYWDDEDKDPWEVFVHEFGHLVHHMTESFDFYNEYKRQNLLFSELLRSEQQASLIGLEIWKWKFPNKALDISYFEEDDIDWLANYYKPFFEVDR